MQKKKNGHDRNWICRGCLNLLPANTVVVNSPRVLPYIPEWLCHKVAAGTVLVTGVWDQQKIDSKRHCEGFLSLPKSKKELQRSMKVIFQIFKNASILLTGIEDMRSSMPSSDSHITVLKLPWLLALACLPEAHCQVPPGPYMATIGSFLIAK